MLETLYRLHIYLMDLEQWIFPEFPATDFWDAKMLAESIAEAYGWDGRQGVVAVFAIG